MIWIVIFWLLGHAELVAVVEIARTPAAASEYERELLGSSLEPSIVGKNQSIALAEFIKYTYYNTIVQDFHENCTFFSKSTQTARDALNIQLSLIFNKDFSGKIKSIQEANDFMMSPEKACSKLQKLLKDNIKKFENNELYKEIIRWKDSLSAIIGEIDVERVYKLGDVILSYEENNRDLPFSIEEDAKQVVLQVYHKYHEWLLYGSIEQGKLGCNEIVKRLMEYIKRTAKPVKFQKFLPIIMDPAQFLALLHILGLDYKPKPPGSAVFLELHKINGRKTVRFKYNSSYIESAICGIECNYDEILEYLESKTLKTKIQSACLNLIKNTEPKWEYYAAGGILSVILFGFLLKSLISWVKKTEKND